MEKMIMMIKVVSTLNLPTHLKIHLKWLQNYKLKRSWNLISLFCSKVKMKIRIIIQKQKSIQIKKDFMHWRKKTKKDFKNKISIHKSCMKLSLKNKLFLHYVRLEKSFQQKIIIQNPSNLKFIPKSKKVLFHL